MKSLLEPKWRNGKWLGAPWDRNQGKDLYTEDAEANKRKYLIGYNLKAQGQTVLVGFSVLIS